MESVRHNINEDVKLFLATQADPELSERTWKVLKKRTSEKLKKNVMKMMQEVWNIVT